MTSTVRLTPATPVSFDVTQPAFWDPAALKAELTRQFAVCDGCRMCVNYCDSFRTMLRRFDEHEQQVDALTPLETREIVDLCFQCKLCYMNCPYIPPHQYALDIPRLFLRAKALGARASGIGVRERVLARVDAIGRLARLAAPLVNALNRFRPNRVVMERVLGVHRDRKLPAFAGETFADWWRARQGGGAR
jgi:glycerol-3-phosphate dehydrogenase subunit C